MLLQYKTFSFDSEKKSSNGDRGLSECHLKSVPLLNKLGELTSEAIQERDISDIGPTVTEGSFEGEINED